MAMLIGTSLVGCAKHDAVRSDEASPAKGVDRGGVATATTTPGMPAPPPSAEAARAVGGATGGGYGAAQANVAAGEWDDNANYRDYAKWLATTTEHRLDPSNRQFIVVTDAHGKPVPDCAITVRGGQASASLETTAAGRAILFPAAYGISAGKLDAQIACGAQHVTATIDASRADTVTIAKLPGERALPARRAVDLAFVLDTTGSMGEEIDAVKATVRAVAAQLQSQQLDVRIALVEYKDRSDPQVTRTFQFSSDLTAFAASVQDLSAAGGGDYPEDMQAGLQTAVDDLQWRDDAVARLAVVIADAPPHLDYQNERGYGDTAKRAAARGIKLFTVAASGMDDTGQAVMRQLASFTGATNMFVLRGGAGPQSVGGGDPKSSCGGTHQNYASGNLDALIVDKLRGELAAVDADPMLIAGVGQDENAKPCDQRVHAVVIASGQ
jgi:hypothetical protein